MWVGLLGPLEARSAEGVSLDVVGGRLRAVLARLAAEPDRLVTVEALVDAVWPDAPPAGAGNALQALVSRLRRALAPDPVARVEMLPGGYRLTGATVDIGECERLAASGQPAAALALFRGDPLVDIPRSSFVDGLRARLTELRSSTAEDLAEADLGSPASLAELGRVLSVEPWRERTRALYLRALVAAGRPAEALRSYEEYRVGLAETLGVDPGPAIRDLHTAILQGDPRVRPEPAPPSARPRAGDGARRGNLRAPLTSFVGREPELARVGAALGQARLVTLVGPGGAGKTRLAIEVARAGLALENESAEAERAWADGAWLVELAPIGDDHEVPAAILTALGRREAGLLNDGAGLGGADRGSGGAIERVVTALRDRDLLLVLDNCEHLLDACARVAEAVLGECPGVIVLATSREALGLTGEVLCPVGPLPLPSSTVDALTAQEFPAVRLLVDRASAVRPDFAVTPDNVAEVVEVCRRLDGLPLAIELAGARLRTLPLAEVATRLGDRFRLLTGGSRTALPRHQTLQAVIGWSWDLFSPEEQRAARRLAVFVGGAGLDAAETVCSSSLDTLGALVEKSFVTLQETPEGAARYVMLDSVRAYAVGRLADSSEADDVRGAHAAYFLAQVERAEPALRTGDQLVWLAWLEREYDNITAALRWAVDSGDAVVAARLVAGLGWYWVLRGGRGEPSSWLTEVLALPTVDTAVPSDTLALTYAYDAIHQFARHGERAAVSGQRAYALAGTLDRPGHPATAFVEAIMRCQPPELPTVLKGLSTLADHDDPWVAAAGRVIQGHAAESAGDATAAIGHLRSARAAFTAIGDRWGVMMAVSALAGSLSLDGDHAAAVEAMTEAAGLADAVGASDDAAWTRSRRGLERLRAGDLPGAEADLLDAWADGEARRSALLVALAETGLAALARHRGELTEARQRATAALERVAATNGAIQPRLRTVALVELGRVQLALGDPIGARTQLHRALAESSAFGDARACAEVLEAYAHLAVTEPAGPGPAALLGLAAAIRGAADAGSPDVRATTAAARSTMGGPAFDAGYASTALLTPVDARTRLAALLVEAPLAEAPHTES